MDKRKHQNDFKGLTDWIEIFKAGRQTDSKGRTHIFTAEDLDQMIGNTSADDPAPHVITHKELYSPFAYARSPELKREGDSLLARSTDINPQFERLIRDGRLFSRSIRINKTDNGYKVGHIAWLGAEPPAVDGLAPVEFNADADNNFDFSVDSYTPGTLSRMMRRMREFFIEKFGIEAADKVMPDWDIDSLTEHASHLRKTQQQDGEIASAFSKHSPEKGDNGMPGLTQEDIDRAEKKARDEAQADFSAREKTLQEQLDKERNQRLASEFSTEISGLVDSGNLTPAQAEGMSDFMLQLSDAEDSTFEFEAHGSASATSAGRAGAARAGDDDKASTVKKTPLQFIRDFMKALPKQVDTGESDAGEDLDCSGAHDFVAPSGAHVDSEQLDLHQKALNYQANHEGVGYIAAVKFVTKQEG